MLDKLIMGQRANRKRIRHRPNRSHQQQQRKYGPLPASTSESIQAASLLQSQPLPSSFHPKKQQQSSLLAPSAMAIRYSYHHNYHNNSNSTTTSPPAMRMAGRERGGFTTPPSSKPNTMFPPAISSSSTEFRGLLEENAVTRDLRVFGGVVEDDLGRSASSTDLDLRGPMLDVVLGLFNGVDYDDEMC